MGIFELLGELINPGPIGRMDFNDKDYEIRQKLIPIRFCISLAIIGIVEYLLLFRNENSIELIQLLKVNIFLIIYLFLGAIINIKPDYDNLGWVPFLFNNPFRFSDNINRFLVVLQIFFLPGKYISKSIVAFFRYYRNRMERS